MKRLPLLLVAMGCLAPAASAQSIEVSRQNRTIEVVSNERITADAEVAEMTIGCVSTAATHDQAYQDNLRRADAILKALFATGLTKTAITDSDVTLEKQEPTGPPSRQGPGGFIAHQMWTIRVAVDGAQQLIDIAVKAGANGIESVTWDVIDPEALETKARAAALEKARSTATGLATALGAKLGAPLYITNVASGLVGLALQNRGVETYTSTATVAGQPTYSLQLFPEKIQKTATVRIVFALD
jgi:uncharacterized protein